MEDSGQNLALIKEGLWNIDNGIKTEGNAERKQSFKQGVTRKHLGGIDNFEMISGMSKIPWYVNIYSVYQHR